MPKQKNSNSEDHSNVNPGNSSRSRKNADAGENNVALNLIFLIASSTFEALYTQNNIKQRQLCQNLFENQMN
jgi:hypothetical protein